jgi:hypothetical protein
MSNPDVRLTGAVRPEEPGHVTRAHQSGEGKIVRAQGLVRPHLFFRRAR